jgi:hypothetical protein
MLFTDNFDYQVSPFPPVSKSGYADGPESSPALNHCN